MVQPGDDPQLAALRNRRDDDRLDERMAKRHEAPRREEGGFERVAVELGKVGRRTIRVVRGELLVARDESGEADRVLEKVGFTRVPNPPDAPLSLARYHVRDVQDSAAQVQEAIDSLARLGVEAAPNHMVACGMRGKSGAPPMTTDQPIPDADPSAGSGVTVVVIDTGIAAAAANRTDGRLTSASAATPGDVDPLTLINKDQKEIDPQEGPYLDDAAGHGTFVAGVIGAVAPAAKVVVIRALDSDGVGSEDALAYAIRQAGGMTPDIINISAGCESTDGLPPVGLRAALDALPKDVMVVAAAGNSGDQVPVWPAAFPDVVAVSGITQGGTPCDWAKRGPWVDVSTYAEHVISTFVPGMENPTRDIDGKVDRWDAAAPVAYWSGTSFAAPHVVGLIAARMKGGDAAAALAGLVAGGSPVSDYGTVITELR